MQPTIILVRDGKLLKPRDGGDVEAFQHFTNGSIAIYSEHFERAKRIAALHNYHLEIQD